MALAKHITIAVYAADAAQQDISVSLNVPQIIELVGMDMTETVMP